MKKARLLSKMLKLSSMATFRNGIVLPTIAQDYYLAGSVRPSSYFKSSEEVFMTRAELLDDAERHFVKAYKEENGHPLSNMIEGLVNIQLGVYPYTREIVINPGLSDRCAASALFDKDKVVRMDYVYMSRTYWLKNGKLELLIDGSVLSLAECQRVMEGLKRHMKWLTTDFQGIFKMATGRKWRKAFLPYWMWRIESKEMEFRYAAISLLNGTIFLLHPKDLPEREECTGDKIVVGDIIFRKSDVQKNVWVRY